MEQTEYFRMFSIENNHWWYKSIHDLLIGVIKKIKLPKKPKILDAGCGTGGLTVKLTNLGETIGFDFSPTAIKLARKRQLNLVQASLNALPFKREVFDVITCITVLGQQGINETKALNDFFRVLKKGGYLILVVSAFQSLYSHHDRAVHARQRYTINEISHFLKNVHLKIIHSRYIFSFIFPIFLIKRLLERFTPQTKAISDLELPPSLVNHLLTTVCLLEWKFTQVLPLPFGTSILIIGKK